jgi:hypothetical protein
MLVYVIEGLLDFIFLLWLRVGSLVFSLAVDFGSASFLCLRDQDGRRCEG